MLDNARERQVHSRHNELIVTNILISLFPCFYG